METKAKIIKEAAKLFAEKGYASASVRNIAREVGIRESAIYNHFKSKLAILNSFIDNSKNSIECRDLLTEELINLLTNPKTFLLKFSESLIEKWNSEEEKILFAILIKEDSNLALPEGASLKDYRKNLESSLTLVFSQMIKHNFISSFEPEKLSELFFAPLILMRIESILYGKNEDIRLLRKYTNKHVAEFYKLIKLK